MATIEFSHVAREWRMKYAEGGLTGGAVKLQALLEKFLPQLKKINGFVSCERVVCGGCNDFKLIIKVKKEAFGEWEKTQFAPESEFLLAAAAVEGVTNVETQTYTFDSFGSSGSAAVGSAAFTLTYFPLMAKGLGCSLVAEFSGLNWNGPKSTGWKMSDWGAMKKGGVSPFGQLPLLNDLADGGAAIGQTTAINNYIGRLAGPSLEGRGRDWATSQMLIAEAEDIYSAAQKALPTRFVKMADQAAYDKFWSETLLQHLSLCEKLCVGAGGFTATGMTVGELSLFSYVHQLTLVNPAILSDKFPKMKQWYGKVAADARTVKVLGGKSNFGPIGQYFMKAGEGGNGF